MEIDAAQALKATRIFGAAIMIYAVVIAFLDSMGYYGYPKDVTAALIAPMPCFLNLRLFDFTLIGSSILILSLIPFHIKSQSEHNSPPKKQLVRKSNRENDLEKLKVKFDETDKSFHELKPIFENYVKKMDELHKMVEDTIKVKKQLIKKQSVEKKPEKKAPEPVKQPAEKAPKGKFKLRKKKEEGEGRLPLF